jgi:endosialidase-like protein
MRGDELMPSDDLLLNVRQIAQYQPASSVAQGDAILLQRGGLGGPYLSIDAQDFVGSALAGGGSMVVNGPLTALSVSGGAAQFSNGFIGRFSADKACIAVLETTLGTVCGVPIATMRDVLATVTSFNLRTGAVVLDRDDIVCAGGAPNFSPRLEGSPRAPTPAPGSSSTRIATTAFVEQAIIDSTTGVASFNTRSGDVVLITADITGVGGALLASPQFTGLPLAPTAAPGTNTEQLATTAFVNAALGSSTQFAPLASPNFSGIPTGPTADPGTATGQLATTAFVENAIVDSTTGVVSFNTRSGAVTLTAADITSAGGAILASPAFTGTPLAPTAAPGTANTQIATTSFVTGALANSVSSFNSRTGAIILSTADITGAGGAALASPSFTGVPAGPTAAPGTSTTQLATTAFVMAAVGVTAFNGRTGSVSLIANDISAAGGATVASPAFTGVPTAPTAAGGTNTTQLATTAFVQAAIGAGIGVSSFNGRAGAITLTGADLSGAGGALLASPALTGSPTAPTAAPGDSDTSIATTAFVQAAIAASGFLPLNGSGTMTGVLNLGAVGVGGSGINIEAPSGSFRSIFGTVGAVDRWRLSLGNGTAETGGSVGSDFALTRYGDAGVLQDSPLFIFRSSGQILISIAPNTPGTGQTAWNAPAGTARGMVGTTAGSPRWGLILASSDAESGANAGSTFQLNRFSDAGASLGNVMSAARATGVVTFAAAIVNGPSDRTLKENIEPLTGALDKVLALQGKSFNMIGDNHRQIGLIAQDVEPIVPEVIQLFSTFDPDTGQPEAKMALDYPKFTALLIEAIKTLAARIEALEGPTRRSA